MYTVKEIMQFITENDVKFIRLSFCDLKGVLKNLSIMPGEAERAFTEGHEFDGTPIFGKDAEKLKLFPDPSTLMAMPWRPAQGRVIRFFCDLRLPDGTAFKDDNRFILKLYNEKSVKHTVFIACPVYLLKTDESGRPTDTPWDEGGYFDVSPLDKGENIRREICLSLDEMKIPVHASYHGEEAGQNIIEFKAKGLFDAADHLVAFKSAAQAIAARNGLYAAFSNKKGSRHGKATLTAGDDIIAFSADSNPYIELRKVFDKTV